MNRAQFHGLEILHVGFHAFDPVIFAAAQRRIMGRGNPTAQAKGRVRLVPSMPVDGLETEFNYAPADRALTIENLKCASEGTLRIDVFVDDAKVAEAGPLIVSTHS